MGISLVIFFLYLVGYPPECSADESSYSFYMTSSSLLQVLSISTEIGSGVSSSDGSTSSTLSSSSS